VTTRVGALVPDVDVGPESELHAMAPPGVAIHASRAPFGTQRKGEVDPTTSRETASAFAAPATIDGPTDLLAAAPLDVIAYCFIGSAWVLGAEGEREMIERLERRTEGIPVTAAATSTVDGLRALGARRIALIAAAWFQPEVLELGRRFYEAAGFEVPYPAIIGLEPDQTKITPSGLHAWITGNLAADVEGVVIVGSGLRCVGVIEALEEDLDCAVLTANQAVLWAALRAAGADTSSVTGYGRLFGCS